MGPHFWAAGELVLSDRMLILTGLLFAASNCWVGYILDASYENPQATVSILPRVAMWMWIALPFVLSLTILLAPASYANQALMNHKIQQEVELALAIDKAKDALVHVATDADRSEELRQEIEYHDKLRTQLHGMRVWPFNAQSNIKAIILFVSNAYVAITSIGGLLTGG
jgi:hypothetical protein